MGAVRGPVAEVVLPPPGLDGDLSPHDVGGQSPLARHPLDDLVGAAGEVAGDRDCGTRRKGRGPPVRALGAALRSAPHRPTGPAAAQAASEGRAAPGGRKLVDPLVAETVGTAGGGAGAVVGVGVGAGGGGGAVVGTAAITSGAVVVVGATVVDVVAGASVVVVVASVVVVVVVGVVVVVVGLAWLGRSLSARCSETAASADASRRATPHPYTPSRTSGARRPDRSSLVVA